MILADNALCIEDANNGKEPYICGLEGGCYKEYENYNPLLDISCQGFATH
mgnify:CR=1 FL=1